MTDLETLRAALPGEMTVSIAREARFHCSLKCHVRIEPAGIEIHHPDCGTIMFMWGYLPGVQKTIDEWWGHGMLARDERASAMMTPDAPETDAERWKRAWLHHITQADPLAASPAGQTIPGGVVDAVRQIAEKEGNPTWGSGIWNLSPGLGPAIWKKFSPQVYGDSTTDGGPPTDFGSQVTEALAHGRGIDPGGQGMRVPSPEEREAERARQAEYFRRNGVL